MHPQPEPAPAGQPTILVVDDYPENCRLLRFYLRGDYEVLIAHSAEEAFEIVDRQRVDLVVMDINLKDGMNGIDAAAAIRARPGLERLPMLAISAYAYPDDRTRFLQAGFDDYIPKPIFKERLLRKVATLLEGIPEPAWVTAPRREA